MLTLVITYVIATLQIVKRFIFKTNQVISAYSYHVKSRETILGDS